MFELKVAYLRLIEMNSFVLFFNNESADSDGNIFVVLLFSDSMLSLKGQLQRPSRRAKKKLKAVLRKFLNFTITV